MAKKKGNIDKQVSDRLNEIREEKALLDDIEKINKSMSSDLSTFLSAKKKIREVDNEINDLAHQLNELGKISGAQNTDEYKNLEKQLLNRQKIAQSVKGTLSTQNLLYATGNSLLKKNNEILQSQNLTFKSILEHINDADDAVRKLNLSLGISEHSGSGIRDVFNRTASYANDLGLSVKDLAGAYQSYADETGRVVRLNDSNLKAISQIAKGTTMGAEQAGAMAGQFELIGKNAEQTRDFYENLVNSSEKFGINSSKVIKLVNDNFKKAQQYVFKGGVKALGDMAKFAEKFKVDMSGVFSAMDKARGLEGAVDMAAQLQVIGGEFAKTDPFQLLFQARNDAAGFAKTMQGLTKNLTTFNKETGEFDIAAGNLDRLRLAADATGQPLENLIEQAKRGAQINMAEGMLGQLTKDNREFVSSIAKIQKGGKIVISTPDGGIKDIRELTDSEISIMREANKSLEARAKESQNFNELITNTINSLKSLLLPIVKPLTNFITWMDTNRDWLKYVFGGMALLAGATWLIKAGANIALGAKDLLGAFKQGQGLMGLAGKGGNLPGASNVMNPTQISSVGTAAGASAKGLLAFGAAILMVGGAISIASIGLAKLVESFNGLTGEQSLGALTAITLTLGGFVSIMYAMIPAITALGIAGTAGSIGLLALGGSFLMIGTGIGIAAAGIGFLVKSMGGLIGSLSQLANPDMVSGLGALALSLPAIALGMTTLGNPLALLGAYALVKTFTALSEVKGIDTLGDNFEKLTTAIAKIDTEKLDKIKETANAISEMDSLSNNIFGALNNIFGEKEMTVKFADNQKVNLQVDITNTIDGNVLGSKISRQIQTSLENGKKEGSSRSL